MKYKGEIILVVLFLYVIALGVVTYDEVFNDGIPLFPAALEKEALTAIDELRSSDPAVAAQAQKKVLDIEDFVTVRLLVCYLDDKDPKMRTAAAQALAQIAAKPYNYEPAPPVPPANAPETQWAEAKRQWRKWRDDNEDRF